MDTPGGDLKSTENSALKLLSLFVGLFNKPIYTFYFYIRLQVSCKFIQPFQIILPDDG